MGAYETELLTNKNYQGNVVIQFLGEFFTIRTPDSGLTVKQQFSGLVSSLVINPTTVDLRRVTTTIASYSFKLLDKNLALSQIVKGTAEDLIGEDVEIYLGRTGVTMDFADYYKMPTVRVKGVSRNDNAYTFSVTEESDRINKPIYTAKTRLLGDVLSATTVLTCKDDISTFPSSGFLRVGEEFVSYTSKNNATKQFFNVIRGELNTTPTAKQDNTDVLQFERLVKNPIEGLLHILISGGGGGPYDTLQSGLGIDQNLIDVAGIEALRDEFFDGRIFDFKLYGISNALRFIESEILLPCNVRFTYSRESKLTLAILNKAKFVDASDVIDEDTTTQFPAWKVDENQITNQYEIAWDYDHETGEFLSRQLFTDPASIALYNEKTPLRYEFKAIRNLFGGQEFIEELAQDLLDRLSTPKPEITVRTHIDKSLLNIGDKSRLESSNLPNADGQLNFATELEVVQRAINYQTGDVSMRLAFTSFSDIRSCYIAPSDTIQSVLDQKNVILGAGRGALWSVGYKVRLWDNVGNAYLSDPVNEIEAISGDQITFVNSFTTTLLTTHRLKFPDYDDAATTQKRYCFIGINFSDFADGGKQYRITP